MLTPRLRVNMVTQIWTVEGKEERTYQLSFEQLRKKSEKHKMKPKDPYHKGVLQDKGTTGKIHLTNEWGLL